MGWFTGVLTLMFVAAKLFNVVAWSWWLVFSPLLVHLVFFLFVFVFGLIVVGLGAWALR